MKAGKSRMCTRFSRFRLAGNGVAAVETRFDPG
jgi:hypothetical protein